MRLDLLKNFVGWSVVCFFILACNSSELQATQKLPDSKKSSIDENGLREAVKVFESGDFRWGYKLLLPYSKAGNAEAKFYVSHVYLRELIFFKSNAKQNLNSTKYSVYTDQKNWSGLSIDQKKGLRLLNESAEEGFAIAKLYLATLHMERGHLPVNKVKVVNLMHEAVNQGVVPAFHALMLIYGDREIVKQDLAEAYKCGYLSINCANKDLEPEARKTTWEAFKESWFGFVLELSKAQINRGKKLLNEWRNKHRLICVKFDLEPPFADNAG